MNEEEYLAIKNVCRKYGYGNVMSLTSALWQHELEAEGAPKVIAFVPALLIDLPPDAIKREELSSLPYKAIIKKFEK